MSLPTLFMIYSTNLSYIIIPKVFNDNAKNLHVNNVQPSSYYQDQESVPAGEICLPVYTPRTAPDLHLQPTYQRSVVQLFLLAVTAV